MKSPTPTLAGPALGIALCMAAWPAHSEPAAAARSESSKESNIGAASGLALGAVAAGPIGAVVGLAAGAVLGDAYHRRTQDLRQSETERARLTQQVAQLTGSLNEAETRAAQLDAAVQRADELGLDVSFRTADDSVTAEAMSPLLKLGALALSLPQAELRVAGYADPRGSDAYNDALSLRRAECVAAVLTSAGVPRERIHIEAYGKTEAKAAAGDLDAYALDRRVTVQLLLPSGGEVARRD
jgi:outer membrane protein OmpA-like peptidoglycan-associated protein